MISVQRSGLSLLLLMLGGVGNLFAEDASILLVNNPFSRPAILAVPAQQPVKREAKIEQLVELQLTATLVSDSTPLVIVEGEMLGIGEKIEGFRLLAVEEGRAVFAKQGKRHTFVLAGGGVDVE